MDISNDIVMWSAIVAFFMPVIITFIQQPRWTQRTRAIVAAITSGVAGLGTVYFTDPDAFLTDGSLTTSVVLTVIIASTAAYQHFWKPVGIRALESATSPGDDTLEQEQAVADLIEIHGISAALEAGVLEDGNMVGGVHVHSSEDPPATSSGTLPQA